MKRCKHCSVRISKIRTQIWLRYIDIVFASSAPAESSSKKTSSESSAESSSESSSALLLLLLHLVKAGVLGKIKGNPSEEKAYYAKL